MRNLIFYFCCSFVGASHTNFDVKRFELCNNTQGQIKFYGNITKENGNQYLTYDQISPVDWGDNLGFQCLIEHKVTQKNFIELFTIREKNMCKAAQMYWGEVWYDIQRHASNPNPMKCPVLAGRTHVHHLQLDFNNIALQTFPFGRIRFTVKGINNKTPRINMFCLLVEVENVFN